MSTVTNTTLLLGLRDRSNDAAWKQFHERYHPLLIRFARHLGLNHQDAEDAAGDTLLAFHQAYLSGKYDRDKGRLRSWLLGIAKNQIRQRRRRRAKEVAVRNGEGETEFLDHLPDDHSISEVWEAQWRDAVLDACRDQVRREVEPETMQAFELVVLEGGSPRDVAKQLGMSRNAVYKAKHRVMSRMREVFGRLKDEW